MICQKYQDLPIDARLKLIGSIVHAIQNDDTFFELACKAIEKAYDRGIFDGVKILPTSEPEDIVE